MIQGMGQQQADQAPDSYHDHPKHQAQSGGQGTQAAHDGFLLSKYLPADSPAPGLYHSGKAVNNIVAKNGYHTAFSYQAES
ncbi:hypothetical protein GCM10022394_04880 [Zobellella aerophila]|uniref:Uncharacterized protein n=1 Tax=Zobellella aerophila TaxID=870480 RepID=A0ABP6V4G7_9GAMM